MHTNPNIAGSAVSIHVLSPFPMSLVYLESQLGVRAIFLVRLSALKTVFFKSKFGLVGDVQADFSPILNI